MLPLFGVFFIAFAAYMVNDYMAVQNYYELTRDLRIREPSFLKWWLRVKWLELTLFSLYILIVVFITVNAELSSPVKKIHLGVANSKLFYVEMALLAYIGYDYLSATLFYRREFVMKSLSHVPFVTWWFKQNGIRLAIAIGLLVILAPFAFRIF